MVKVCDAIMGTGKSSAAITYINEHPDKRFIYITPYLEEATRIKDSCYAAHFVEPSNKIAEFDFKKSVHTAALIKEGRNIATTHQAFREYTNDMLSDVRNNKYTLIIDENIDLLGLYDIHHDDFQLAVSSGYVKEEGGVYSLINNEYDGKTFHDLFRIMKSRNMMSVSFDGKESFYYWVLPPDLILSFEDVFILTYMFSGQSACSFLQINSIPFSYIGVLIDGNGTYRFTDGEGSIPEYVSRLGEMIHIVDHPKLNDVGANKYALSQSWFDRGGDGIDRLRKNIGNCFKNVWNDADAEKRLWGSFNSARYKLRGKGYANSFLVFNARATNDYKDRDHLVYAANVFMNVNDKLFFNSYGLDVDEDSYALSTMIQWIWRSAIREGKEIYIYIPSSRMRTMLVDWINSFEKGT